MAFTPENLPLSQLKHTGELYTIEAERRDSPADERLAVRKARTISLMQSL